MSELMQVTIRQGGVEYAAFQAGPQELELRWRYLKISGAEWRLAGYLVADGKLYRCLTWDRQDIGPADSVRNGMHAVISWNLPSSAVAA